MYMKEIRVTRLNVVTYCPGTLGPAGLWALFTS